GDDVAEIKHAPGVAGVVGDVRAGHVTALDDQAGIVGADGGPEHRAAAPRADDAPRVVTGRRSESGVPIELGGLSGPPRPPTGRGSGSGGQHEARYRHHHERTLHARYSLLRSRTHSATASDWRASFRLGEAARPARSVSRKAAYSP